MRNKLALSAAMVAAAALVLVGFLVFGGDDTEPAEAGESGAALVREDSPVLSEGDQAVFVEFLDFECEGCVALYPFVEDLRERYGDQVSFVVRHMPLHGNSLNAAKASEAAAQQGEFEPMYKVLFENSEEWGHQETSQRDLFFSYAQELGLDMEQFEADFDDPATLARIEQSIEDAEAFGVTGTPTVFLDGERIELTTVTDLEDRLNAAIND